MEYFLPLVIASLLLVNCREASATNDRCPKSCVCMASFVSCSNLTHFPVILPIETRTITLSEVKIPEIQTDIISNLPEIKSLSFENCTIGKIRSGAFRNLTNLQKISFSLCSIRLIETDAFHQIRNASTMLFYKMTIERIETHAFSNIRGLKEWTLFKSNIGEIEAEAFHQFSYIYSFSIYSNRIGRLGRAVFSSMGNIKYVDFFMNKVTDVGCNVFDFSTNEFENFEFYANIFSCDCKLFGLSRGRQAINFSSSSAKRDSPTTNKVTPTKRSAGLIDSHMNTVSAKKWSFDELLYRNWCMFKNLKHKVSLDNYRYTEEVECETNACFPLKSKKKDKTINSKYLYTFTSLPEVPVSPRHGNTNDANRRQSAFGILLLSTTILTMHL
ncbi:unnamed protein product [Acanthosepion pharaonis]|uniref:Uncharacterized protein n=1 Tax=Acanthosepion pharaonis TaxID=158019 RepID=A0A812DG48_ACAPH|nr:unnamed protein product [Sepia pharaonis]